MTIVATSGRGARDPAPGQNEVAAATPLSIRVSVAARIRRSTSRAGQRLRVALAGLALSVFGIGCSHAGEQPGEGVAARPLGADAAAAESHGRPIPVRLPRRPYAAGQIIEVNVHRLSQGLALDSAQQIKLRQILVNHYQQLIELRTAGVPGADPAGALRAIVDRTRERIRSILDDAQKQKYSTDVSPQLAGPSRADLDHWLEVRDVAAAQRPEPMVKEN